MRGTRGAGVRPALPPAAAPAQRPRASTSAGRRLALAALLVVVLAIAGPAAVRAQTPAVPYVCHWDEATETFVFRTSNLGRHLSRHSEDRDPSAFPGDKTALVCDAASAFCPVSPTCRLVDDACSLSGAGLSG